MEKENNYAFIDSQNLNLGINKLNWKLDFKKFRVYLKEKYKISQAFLFIGFIPGNQNLYLSLKENNYILIFKPILFDNDRKPKGNVDADLVLQSMIEFNNYSKAIIVSSDGDFYCLVKYLYGNEKLLKVISPDVKNCSKLLKKTAKEKIVFMDNLRKKLEYLPKKKSTV
ncbi:MAG: NYN domain-containing protein [Patescibacteria group bacterium]|nr:NYN domain-containing protein [Patescibacteria group bacterium]